MGLKVGSIKSNLKRGKKAVKNTAKTIKSGASKAASQVKKGVRQAGRGVERLGQNAEHLAKEAWKIQEDAATTVFTGGGNLAANAVSDMVPEIPDPVAPAAPAPDPEIGTQQLGADENISRRRRRNRRKGLRIDLNTGGGPSGNGVNLPIG